MTPDVILKILELAGSALMGLLGAALWLARQSYKQGVKEEQFRELQRKVQILMVALYRRGGVELVLKGEDYATMNSPLYLGKMSVEMVLPFLDVFLPFYCALIQAKPGITDQEMFWAIEEQFGDLIVERICIPNKLSQLGCLTAILEFCKLNTKERPNA